MIAGWWAGRGSFRSLLAGRTEDSWKATSLRKKATGSRLNPVIKPYYKLDKGLLHLWPCFFPGSFPINSYPGENASLNKDCVPKNSHKMPGAQGTGPKGRGAMSWWSVNMTAFREGSKCARQTRCGWRPRQAETLQGGSMGTYSRGCLAQALLYSTKAGYHKREI